MNITIIIPMLVALLAQDLGGSDKDSSAPKVSETRPADRVLHERLSKLYREEAESYTIYRDATRKEKVELQSEPVYLWTNPLRSGGQDGAVYVWTCRGRAEVVGCIFSDPATGPRHLNHEFHSLSLSVLDVTRSGAHNWTPEGPGIDLKPIRGAPAPSDSPKQRLVQMRAPIRNFTGNTFDKNEKRWELRALAHPFYRYASRDPDVLDGAVFAFVTSAGTDPEAIVVLEARRPEARKSPVWQFGVGRFTDNDLWVRLKGNEVFVVERIEWNGPRQDPKHRYRAFTDRTIQAVEDTAP